ALVDVQRLAVGAHLDAVGRAHLLRYPRRLALRVYLPHLPRALPPVGVAGVQRAVRGDGQVVGLVHFRLVGADDDLLRLPVDGHHVVADVVRDVHRAIGAEDDAVAGALAGQRHPDFAFAFRRDPADGLLLGEVDHEDVALGVAGRALDPGREALLLR